VILSGHSDRIAHDSAGVRRYGIITTITETSKAITTNNASITTALYHYG